jgi:hypothetical protein
MLTTRKPVKCDIEAPSQSNHVLLVTASQLNAKTVSFNTNLSEIIVHTWINSLWKPTPPHAQTPTIISIPLTQASHQLPTTFKKLAT